MGMFKAMKDMKQMVAVAPSMIQEAQYLQANAMQVQAQHASAQQSVMAQQAAAATHPEASASDMLAPIAGVSVEQYVPVGAALLWTLEKGLGEAFTPEIREAWATTYRVLAGTMIEAANEMPKAA